MIVLTDGHCTDVPTEAVQEPRRRTPGGYSRSYSHEALKMPVGYFAPGVWGSRASTVREPDRTQEFRAHWLGEATGEGLWIRPALLGLVR